MSSHTLSPNQHEVASGIITPSPLASQFPQISHYIVNLLQVASQENGTSQGKENDNRRQHPLSVSSASSDVHDDDNESPPDAGNRSIASSSSPLMSSDSELQDDSDRRNPNSNLKLDIPDLASGIQARLSSSTVNYPIHIPSSEREELTRKVVDLLGGDKEEEVKGVLKQRLGNLGNDEGYIDQICLDLMHKHKDDMDGVPYTPFSITPIRPKASPIPTHAQPFRNFTPARVPSLRTRTPLGRPQSPVPERGAGVIGSGSPGLTRTISQTSVTGTGASSILGAAGFNTLVPGASPRASPASSPRLGARSLNFIPSGYSSPSGAVIGGSMRPGSGAVTPTGNTSKSSLPLPAPHATVGGIDPWQAAFGHINSPLGTPPVMSRSNSQLAFHSQEPVEEASYPFPGTQPLGVDRSAASSGDSQNDLYDQGVDDIFSTSAMSRHKHMLPDEEDDEFSPFGQEAGLGTSPATKLLATAKAFDPTKLGAFTPPIGGGALGGSYFGGGGGDYNTHVGDTFDHEEFASGMMTPGGSTYAPGPDDPNYLGEGMTPLDVLQSVFTSLPVGDLEDALRRAGYNFEEAMAQLIAQNGGTRSGNSGAATPTRDENGPMGYNNGTRPNVFAPGGPASRAREQMPPGGYYQGGRSTYGMGGPGNASPRFGMGGSGTRTPGGLKMCRYYLAGECRRSDCRFSHDVDRALCRFWLRGQCAKGDQCEFIHALPSVDPSMLNNAMSRIELSHDGTSRTRSRPDEFPDLNMSSNQRGPVFDPSRNRFANAVKRQAPTSQTFTQIGGQRASPVVPPSHRPFSSGSGFRRRIDGPGPSGPPMPVPSPRIRLRPPTLIPTLPTGSDVNDMYMEARQAAIKLGQARNACLARAAEAWRRGDGATAKQMSRQANLHNHQMTVETADAAANLVRQRRSQVQDAIRSRGEGSAKECAGGLGVVLGVATLGSGQQTLSPSERTEVLLDLHMLHANEASDVLEDFLMALERENFYGLAYVIVGDERHVGSQDTGRGASRYRLATGVKTFLQRFGYPWSESGGCICIDPLTHM